METKADTDKKPILNIDMQMMSMESALRNDSELALNALINLCINTKLNPDHLVRWDFWYVEKEQAIRVALMATGPDGNSVVFMGTYNRQELKNV